MSVYIFRLIVLMLQYEYKTDFTKQYSVKWYKNKHGTKGHLTKKIRYSFIEKFRCSSSSSAEWNIDKCRLSFKKRIKHKRIKTDIYKKNLSLWPGLWWFCFFLSQFDFSCWQANLLLLFTEVNPIEMKMLNCFSISIDKEFHK